MEYKFTNEHIDTKQFFHQHGKYSNMINEFLKVDARNCEITFKNSEERRIAVCSIRTYVKKHNLNITTYVNKNKVYLIKC